MIPQVQNTIEMHIPSSPFPPFFVVVESCWRIWSMGNKLPSTLGMPHDQLLKGNGTGGFSRLLMWPRMMTKEIPCDSHERFWSRPILMDLIRHWFIPIHLIPITGLWLYDIYPSGTNQGITRSCDLTAVVVPTEAPTWCSTPLFGRSPGETSTTPGVIHKLSIR